MKQMLVIVLVACIAAASCIPVKEESQAAGFRHFLGDGHNHNADLTVPKHSPNDGHDHHSLEDYQVDPVLDEAHGAPVDSAKAPSQE